MNLFVDDVEAVATLKRKIRGVEQDLNLHLKECAEVRKVCCWTLRCTVASGLEFTCATRSVAGSLSTGARDEGDGVEDGVGGDTPHRLAKKGAIFFGLAFVFLNS